MNSRKITLRSLLVPASIFTLLGSATSLAANEPDVTRACAKECPSATTNEDTFKCVDAMINEHVQKTLKPQHQECFNALENFVKTVRPSGTPASPGPSGSSRSR